MTPISMFASRSISTTSVLRRAAMLPRPASRLPSHLPEHSAPRSLKTPSAPPSPACQRIAPSRSYSAIPQGSPTENVDEKTNFQRLTGRAVALFAVTAGGLLLYFKHEKDKRDAERAANPVRAQQTTGKPLVGGPFSLVNQDGIPVTDLSFRGKWMLIYFGFTHCPDVCPEELERMAKIIDNLDNQPAVGNGTITPIFISCDPKRDSVEAVRLYVKEFHPKLQGLTGTYDQIKSAAKSYRLYFSAPSRALDDDETDYLVDHSIFFYLMDPEGKYARHYGKIDSVERITEDVTRIVKEYKTRK